MNLKEVHRLLQDCFQKELTNGRKRHIVFWYDEEGEFVSDIDDIHLDHVRVWKVSDRNLFATKYELEKNDPSSHFLLYFNRPKPSPHEDWLYDLYKVGQEFATDKLTVIMRELGITDNGLKEIFRKYKAFFNNKSRLQVFYKYPVTAYTEEAIDITVLAALCKSATNTIDDIIRNLMRKEKEGDHTVWDNIQKYGDETTFWLLVERYYGYTLPEKSLQSLLTFLVLTYLVQQSNAMDLPDSWEPYVSNRPTNVIVFMDQWMNHQDEREVFNQLAKSVAYNAQAASYTEKWDVHHMVEMDAFPLFDEKVIDYLVKQLMDNLKHYDHYLEMIATRRRLHWYPEYRNEYEALYQAVQLQKHMEKLDHFIPEQSSSQMFQAYVNDYYRIDTAYRKFYVAYDQVVEKERLYPLREKVENIYGNHFIAELAMKWAGSKERATDQTWPIPGIPQQNDFYHHSVQGYLANDERIFVIISDALRYEVANELTDALNNGRRATAKLTAMQSVLPSYTALGMAALLPHKQVSYTDDGKVILDGVHAAGTANRNQILQNITPDALAIQYQDIVSMNRNDLRQTLYGKKVIYVYHNVIDARGDNSDTEMEVFQAAEEAIDDILALVNRLVNTVSASNILITADHGFIYQRDRLEKSQKLPDKPENTIITSRRFSISKQQEPVEGTLTYSMDLSLQQDKPLFVTVPKGINRFSIQGSGANYVHGGAMLQEIVVPLITFKNDRSKSSANAVSKVDVKLTTPTRKITNTVTYLEFFQMDKVAEKMLPRRLKLYFVDEAGNRISNENIIIAETTSSQATERTSREKFVFRAKAYDKRGTYYLILEDEETKTDPVYERYAFTIDIALGDGG
ncbi:BREX-1 system phosphatase PglZ type A [Virgibacillus dakarensis]|uniref:BREX-1 system phosphatase PglZ type A n=1 Tax=Virgibacillus dakarensis TaxID=1917889 RepID=UPI000B4320FB|nr:BREX-1 system phosphatase PglZ type A [Virgibacillus dakarensis]